MIPAASSGATTKNSAEPKTALVFCISASSAFRLARNRRQREVNRLGPPTSDVLAAVDVQLRAADVARLVAAEEIDGLGHLLGLAQAPQWDLLLHDLVGARREDGGVDLARRDGVDADAAWAE